ncbi:MAG: sensor histidine kinase [Chromatiales bacterium]|nr:sensor histidine kinase [Chromatiales bacterium]
MLSNAVKYNDSTQPEILVKLTVTDGILSIDVIDNGGGVSSEEALALFEKFNRGRRARSDQGAGLGLPISRVIMRTMGGDLTVEFKSTGSAEVGTGLAPSSSLMNRCG